MKVGLENSDNKGLFSLCLYVYLLDNIFISMWSINSGFV